MTRFETKELANKFYVKEIRTLKTGREKCEHYYAFNSEERRAFWISQQTETIQKQEAALIARKEERKVEAAKIKEAFVNPFKVGDLLYSSWGYDQTNIDFYQVIKAGPKSVTVQEICGKEAEHQEGFSPMSGHTSAVKDSFLKDSKPSTHPVRAYYDGQGVLRYGICFGRYSLSPTTAEKVHYYSWYA